MIRQQFDFTIAEYNSLAEVQKEEVVQADLVRIRGYVEGGIYHSENITWKGDLEGIEKADDFIRSKKERKHLQEAREYFLSQGYTIFVKEVDKKLLDVFMKLYAETTLKKDRAIDYQAETIVHRNLLAGLPVYLFGMFKGDELVSGLIATLYQREMRVAFGAKRKFTGIRGGVGGVLEIEFMNFCIKNNFRKTSHGMSSNPAGIFDLAGIFEFKSRYGFNAFPSGSWYTSFILSNKITLTDLVFVSIHQNQLCQIVITQSTENVMNKYQTKEVPLVIQKSLSEEIQKSKKFFQV